MKTLKDNEPKVTKDVLLHQIFQEIAEENKEINNDPYLNEIIPTPKKRKLFKIRKIQKKWQRFFIVILIISIFYVLFSTNTQTTQSEEDKIGSDIYTIPHTNQIKEQKKEDIIIEPNPIQITEDNSMLENHIVNNDLEEKSIASKPQTVIMPEKPKTEREKAKKELFRQMQN